MTEKNFIVRHGLEVYGNANVSGSADISGDLKVGGNINVSGSAYLSGGLTLRGNTSSNSNLNIGGNTSLGGSLTVSGATNITNTLTVSGNADLNRNLDVSGNTCLGGTLYVSGTTSLGSSLNVSGNTSLGGTLTVSGNTDLNRNLDVSGNTCLGGTLTTKGSASFNSTLNVTNNTGLGGTLYVSGTTSLGSSLNVSGNTSLGGTLTVSGNADLNRNLDVSGNTCLGGTLYVSGTTSLGSSLNVSGNTSLGGTLTVSGATNITNTLTVSGNANLNGNLDISGNTSLHGTLVTKGSASFSSTLDVKGNTSLGGSLTVSGVTDINNTLNVSGNTSIGGNLTITGNTSINGGLVVSGSLQVGGAGGSGFNVDSNATFGGTLTVSGNADLNSNLDVSGTLSASTLKGANHCGTNANFAYLSASTIRTTSFRTTGTLTVCGSGDISGNLQVAGILSGTQLRTTSLRVTGGTAAICGSMDVSGSVQVAGQICGGTIKSSGDVCFQSNAYVNQGAGIGINAGTVGLYDTILVGERRGAGGTGDGYASITLSPGAFGSKIDGTTSFISIWTNKNAVADSRFDILFGTSTEQLRLRPRGQDVLVASNTSSGVRSVAICGSLQVSGTLSASTLKGANHCGTNANFTYISGTTVRTTSLRCTGNTTICGSLTVSQSICSIQLRASYASAGQLRATSGNITTLIGSYISYTQLRATSANFTNQNITNLTVGGTLTAAYISATSLTTSGTITIQNVTNQALFKTTGTNPTVIHRNDGSNYWILLSNSFAGPCGTWNTLRPFYINTGTGLLHSLNGQFFTGGARIGGGLTVSGAASLCGALTVGAKIDAPGQTISAGTVRGGSHVCGGNGNFGFASATQLRSTSFRTTNLYVRGNAFLSGTTRIQDEGHEIYANDYHLELYTPNNSVSDREVSLRFHHGSRWYYQIRARSGGFWMTQGNTGDLVDLTVSDLRATYVCATQLRAGTNVCGTNGNFAYVSATTLRTTSLRVTGNGTNSICGGLDVSGSVQVRGVLSGTQLRTTSLRVTGGGKVAICGDGGLRIGPNSTWSQFLNIGGNGNQASTSAASVVTTNGNLHLDAADGGHAIYLNWYGGTNGTYFGAGDGNTATGRMDGAGNFGAVTSVSSPIIRGANHCGTNANFAYVSATTLRTTSLRVTGNGTNSICGGLDVSGSVQVRGVLSGTQLRTTSLRVTGGTAAICGSMDVSGSVQVRGSISSNRQIFVSSTGTRLTMAGPIGFSRTQSSAALWFNGIADTNHVLWNDYYGGPTTRGAAGSGFDGIYWNVFRGLQIRGGSAGAYNIIRTYNSGGGNNDHIVELYANNVRRLNTYNGGVDVCGTLSASTLQGTTHVCGANGNFAYVSATTLRTTSLRITGNGTNAICGGLDVSGSVQVRGLLSGTQLRAASTGFGTVSYRLLQGPTTNTRDKIRVWNSNRYTIGMESAVTFGGLNDYAMTFQMNNDNDRGWWWGDEAHTKAQGAMALRTDGRVNFAGGARIGFGINDTGTPGANGLAVNGTTYLSGALQVKSTISAPTVRGITHVCGGNGNFGYASATQLRCASFRASNNAYISDLRATYVCATQLRAGQNVCGANGNFAYVSATTLRTTSLRITGNGTNAICGGLDVSGSVQVRGVLSGAQLRTTSLRVANNAYLSGTTRMQDEGHEIYASDYHLELFSPNNSVSDREVSLRFHHANRWWYQIRARSGGFWMTNGSDGNLVDLTVSDLRATYVSATQLRAGTNVCGANSNFAYASATQLRCASFRVSNGAYISGIINQRNTHRIYDVATQMLLKEAGTQETVIHRNDGTNYYILLSNATTGVNGSWNSLRPFYINVSNGRLHSLNGQYFTGKLDAPGQTISAGTVRGGSHVCGGNSNFGYASATTIRCNSFRARNNAYISDCFTRNVLTNFISSNSMRIGQGQLTITTGGDTSTTTSPGRDKGMKFVMQTNIARHVFHLAPVFNTNANGVSQHLDKSLRYDFSRTRWQTKVSLDVSGTLTARTKNFLIDHPTKEKHKLQYSSLEGPESAVYVRGKLVDSEIIPIPDYWSSLVHEDSVTVTLTPVGINPQIHSIIKSNNTSVRIASQGKINCHYVVYGERKDVDKLVVEFESDDDE